MASDNFPSSNACAIMSLLVGPTNNAHAPSCLQRFLRDVPAGGSPTTKGRDFFGGWNAHTPTWQYWRMLAAEFGKRMGTRFELQRCGNDGTVDALRSGSLAVHLALNMTTYFQESRPSRVSEPDCTYASTPLFGCYEDTGFYWNTKLCTMTMAAELGRKAHCIGD